MTTILNGLEPTYWREWFASWVSPSQWFVAPNSRLFWGFCLSSILLALVALWWQHRYLKQHSSFGRHVWHSVLSPRHWCNRSSLIDLTLLLFNRILRKVFLLPLLGTQLALGFAVAHGLERFGGEVSASTWPWWAIAALYTVVLFFVDDGSRFLLHYCLHKVPWLWCFHRVHHSATTLTPLTLFRVHPVEMSLYFVRSLLIFAAVSGVFIYAFAGQLSALQILGVNVFAFAFNLLGANLRHSPVWLSFGRWERWFISPAQHQIHHSQAPQHHNRNFGSCMAVWDRILGTHFYAGLRPQPITYGLGMRKALVPAARQESKTPIQSAHKEEGAKATAVV